jgi:hypothetical protein
MQFSPVSNGWLMDTFRHRATLERLRVDRTLEEVLAHPGDPVHIAAVFGLTQPTAIRYAESARCLLASPAEYDSPA